MDSNLSFPEAIDSTARKAFAACPTKFLYENIRRITRDNHSIHLLAGKSFARGLEVARWSYWAEDRGKVGALCDGVRALIEEWGEEDECEYHNKSLWGMLAAFYHYWMVAWPPEEDPLQPYIRPTGAPAVEYSFDFPIEGTEHPETGKPIRMIGRFDMLAELGGMRAIVDEKTSGTLGAQFTNGWDLKGQMTAYCAAAQHFGHDVSLAIIRGISPQKRDVKSVEVHTWREPWQIEQWYEQVKDDLAHMIWYWKRGKWPMNLEESCTAYGGCPFKDVCLSKNPEQEIQFGYVENTWSPLE